MVAHSGSARGFSVKLSNKEDFYMINQLRRLSGCAISSLQRGSASSLRSAGCFGIARPTLAFAFLCVALCISAPSRGFGQAWTLLGPNPEGNAAAEDNVTKNAESGRILDLSIHPTNPKIIYFGAADGGLYRSLDGGDNIAEMQLPPPPGPIGQSQAVSAIAISLADPDTLFVGTGQSANANNSFAGVGLYVIKSASGTFSLTGPFNLDANGKDVFTGGAISRIVATPDGNTIFVSTGGEPYAGIDNFGAGSPTPPLQGLYRSTNIAGGTPTFTRLTGEQPTKIVDMVAEPGNPAHLIYYATSVSGNGGGIWVTKNALDEMPTFTQTLTVKDGVNGKLAINKVGTVVTVLLVTDETPAGVKGMLRVSSDGGDTWVAVPAANGFGGSNGNIAVGIDPTNASIFYLGGASAGSEPTVRVVTETVDGGLNFTPGSIGFIQGLHPDSQLIRVAPSDPTIVYHGGDGGLWRTDKGGVDWKTAAPIVWTDLNSAALTLTQFNSLTSHPKIRSFIFGGAQDNGSPLLRPDGKWVEYVGGDGGAAVMDQTATDTSDVTVYHCYTNSSGAIKLERCDILANGSPGPAGNTELGAANGIGQTDKVLFYNPMALGPGSPNVLYFGTDRLYRSTNRGDNFTLVGSTGAVDGGSEVTAIGISPQDDNVRIIATKSGKIFATTTGGTFNDVSITLNGTAVTNYPARVVIDPNNKTTAYVAFNGFGLPNAHVFKTTNLDTAAPTWTASGQGIPDLAVNALAVDPADSTHIYAGTDQGVYNSTDGGQTWAVYGTGLPVMAVFDLSIQSAFNVLRAATYGRGAWEIPLAPTGNAPVVAAAPVAVAFVPGTLTASGPVGLSGSTVDFTLTLPQASSQPVTVNFSTSDGSAVAGVSYTGTSGTVTFAPGVTSQTIQVQVLNDPDRYQNETFYLNLEDPSSDARLGVSQLVGTIVSTLQPPAISIADTSATQSATPATAVFTLSLSASSTEPISVNFATAEGTALPGDDYAPTSGTVTFTPGSTSGTISIPINATTAAKPTESFRINLSNPTGEAVLSNTNAIAVISNTNGAAAPDATFSTTAAVVISDGTTAAPYPSQVDVTGLTGVVDKVTVTLYDLSHTLPMDMHLLLVGPQGQTVVLMSAAGGEYPVSDVNLTFDDSAAKELPEGDQILPGRYQPSQFLDAADFPGPAPAGPYAAALSAFNGTAPNGAWQLYVVSDLSGDSGAIAGGWSLTVSTEPAAATPFVTVGDVLIQQDSLGTKIAEFTAHLSQAQETPVSFVFQTADGTATSGTDYVQTSGTVTFVPGETEQTIDVETNPLTVPGPATTFFVYLSDLTGPSAAFASPLGYAAEAMGTIVDTQVIPQININDLGQEKSVDEGAGLTVAGFTVSLSAASDQEVDVNYSTEDDTAIAGTDYVATAGTLVFPPGTTEMSIFVPLIAGQNKGDVDFFVNLDTPVNSTIIKAQGQAIIAEYQAPRILAKPLGDVALQGDEITLSVGAEGAQPLEYQWMLNGVNVSGGTNADLDITDVQPKQAGAYTVVVSNTFGSVTSDPAPLEVIADQTMKAVEGSYYGTIGGDTFAVSTAGTISIKVLPKGNFTVQFMFGGQRYGKRGHFDANGAANLVLGSGARVIDLQLQLDLGGGDDITGTITSLGVVTTFFAPKVGTGNSPLAGRYTIVLPHNPTDLTAPQGDGYGVLVVDKHGTTRFTGKLGDGTAFVESSHISDDGYWNVYIPLYGGGGVLSGDVDFLTMPGSALSGVLNWYKPQLNQAHYPAGFSTTVNLVGQRYNAPTGDRRILNFGLSGVASVQIQQGDLVNPLTESITFNSGNGVVAAANPVRFSMVFRPFDGRFEVRFRNPTTNQALVGFGVVQQATNTASGEFLGRHNAGSIELTVGK